ncbi:MAG: ABC transporter ATP-binding protein [Pirellulaceae bacterium]
MSDANVLLKVDSLGYRYGKRVAVGDATFEVGEGECFGLLGPNGAGKTTTLSCIAGLLTDWSGKMAMRGNDFVPAKRNADRAELGLVPQDIAVYPNLTAEENLSFFAKLSGVARAELSQVVEQNLELAGLQDRRKDLVRTFSGGMKRRLNLACGVLHSPALVLLDEPTVGVDPQSRNHLFETLIALKEAGTSLLYTTHYMEEAERLCDRIAIMNEGQVIATGTAAELAEQSGDREADLEQVFLHFTGRRLRDD